MELADSTSSSGVRVLYWEGQPPLAILISRSSVYAVGIQGNLDKVKLFSVPPMFRALSVDGFTDGEINVHLAVALPSIPSAAKAACHVRAVCLASTGHRVVQLSSPAHPRTLAGGMVPCNTGGLCKITFFSFSRQQLLSLVYPEPRPPAEADAPGMPRLRTDDSMLEAGDLSSVVYDEQVGRARARARVLRQCWLLVVVQ
eukprot:gene4236-4535_t